MGLQEIWTLCRIFKRDLSQKKYTPGWREVSVKRKQTNSRPEAAGNMDLGNRESYIWFGGPEEANIIDHNEKKPNFVVGDNSMHEIKKELMHVVSEPESCSSTVLSDEAMEFFAHRNWDEIVSAMDDYAFHPSHF